MQLEIDGELYELPLVSSFDLDEDRIFFKATNLHAEDVWMGLQDGGGLSFSVLLQNEGFLPAMAHIAYRREHPDDPDDLIVKVVGRQKRVEMIGSLARSLEDDASGEPVGTTSVPDGSSKSSKQGKRSTRRTKEERSGKRSKSSSDRQDVTPAPTGTDESDGRSTSARLRQVI